MAMAYGLVSESRAAVRPGTVIKLTPEELSSDPVDQSNTRVRAMFKAYNEPPKFQGTEAGPAKDVRTQILGMSLFPNVVNSKKTYDKKETGTFRAGTTVG
jgi:hypothetical protein